MSEQDERPVTFDDESVLVELWSDPKRRERYQYVARETYESIRRYQDFARQGHVEYGKWLIASLLAVHGGSIYALNSLRTAVRPDQIPGLITSASWHLGGIFLILLSGFFAWLNFQFAEIQFANWAKPLMIFKTDEWPQAVKRRTNPVGAALYAASACGVVSGLCFLFSAVDVISVLRS